MTYLSLLIPAAVFLLLFVLERIVPLRRRTRGLLRRLAKNLTLTAIVFLVGSLIVKNTGLATSRWITDRHVGIALLIPLPKWGGITLGFLLIDLSFYYWHMANHRIRLLWRFHNVHHIDPDLDVSTSFRFHFVEIAYSSVFRIVQVLVIGVAPFTYVIYETVFTIETMFHHSNVRLPLGFERWLNKIVVTPRMHGVHHSAVRGETNPNYNVIFSWWDRLHRTLVLNVPQLSIRIGVPGYQNPQDNRFWNLLRLPFIRQKEYWRFPDGTLPRSNQDNTYSASRLSE
jgi:sterol desaturase/sphingolipid hydroxylase (fatty acid hydroxylase superfamily)